MLGSKRGELNGSKLVLVCKRSKSKVYVCTVVDPLYLKGLFLRQEGDLSWLF